MDTMPKSVVFAPDFVLFSFNPVLVGYMEPLFSVL
jgi:hypothetical protein